MLRSNAIAEPIEDRALAIDLVGAHLVVLEDRWGPGDAIGLLVELGAHLIHLGLHDSPVALRLGNGFLQHGYIINCPCERFPFAGFVGLARWKTQPERFEAVFHFAASFALGEFVRYP